MSRAWGLHHFKRGISTVKQWTGHEAKEMMKTFVPLIAEDCSIHNDVAAFIRALLDFSYIAHTARLTKTELEELQGAHAEMHQLKGGLRLEALRIHQAHLDEYYGPPERRSKPANMAVFIDDNEEDIEYWPKGGEDEGEGNKEDWEDQEDWEDWGDKEEDKEEGRC
ncbi:hypothetical protein FRC10_002450 [Ceratobasidium sp. 414]|nr:hypothetical protein FRC10_002450 [Ceratobasidium sp. 414]